MKRYWFVQYLLVALCLSGCTGLDGDCDILSISVAQEEVIWRPEPNVRVRFSAASYSHSHAHFICSAWWDGPPLVEGSPTALLAELCVGGRCEKALGSKAEFKVWAEDWYDLKHYDAAYCIVYTPSWDRMELQPNGDVVVVETFPEKVITRVRYPLTLQCKSDGEEDVYCHDGYYGPEGWTCTHWD